jgi:hypothetical protein
LVQEFIGRIRREFAAEIAQDPKALKTSVLRLVRRGLPPKPGRPRDPRIDAAVQMFEQGMTIKQVLRSQVAEFDKLDRYGSYLADKGLRAAIARRRSAPHRSRSLKPFW